MFAKLPVVSKLKHGVLQRGEGLDRRGGAEGGDTPLREWLLGRNTASVALAEGVKRP